MCVVMLLRLGIETENDILFTITPTMLGMFVVLIARHNIPNRTFIYKFIFIMNIHLKKHENV